MTKNHTQAETRSPGVSAISRAMESPRRSCFEIREPMSGTADTYVQHRTFVIWYCAPRAAEQAAAALYNACFSAGILEKSVRAIGVPSHWAPISTLQTLPTPWCRLVDMPVCWAAMESCKCIKDAMLHTSFAFMLGYLITPDFLT